MNKDDRRQLASELAFTPGLMERLQALPEMSDLGPAERMSFLISMWEVVCLEGRKDGVLDDDDPDPAAGFTAQGHCEACMDTGAINEFGFCKTCWKELSEEAS